MNPDALLAADPVVVAPAAFPDLGPETLPMPAGPSGVPPAFRQLGEVLLEVTVELGSPWPTCSSSRWGAWWSWIG